MSTVVEPLRLLFVVPFPPNRSAFHGGGRVTGGLIAQLSRRHRVAVVCLRGSEEPPTDPLIVERAVEVIEVPRAHAATGLRGLVGVLVSRGRLLAGEPTWVQDLRSDAFASRLSALARSWRPDVVQIEYPVMSHYVADLQGIPAKRVLVEHDPSSRLMSERSAAEQGRAKKLIARAEARAWRRWERRAFSLADAVVAFTDEDADFIRGRTSTPVWTIPFGWEVPDRPLAPPTSASPRLLFVGSFIHRPNVDAALWLANEIFPVIRASHPDVALDVVGYGASRYASELAGDRIEIHDGVESVTPFFEGAAVVVAPVRIGGGMRVKILDALAAGRPLVATRRAVAGLLLEPGRDLLVGDTTVEIAAAVGELLEDVPRRHAVGIAAHRWARASVSWDRTVELLERLYRSLLKAR